MQFCDKSDTDFSQPTQVGTLQLGVSILAVRARPILPNRTKWAHCRWELLRAQVHSECGHAGVGNPNVSRFIVNAGTLGWGTPAYPGSQWL